MFIYNIYFGFTWCLRFTFLTLDTLSIAQRWGGPLKCCLAPFQLPSAGITSGKNHFYKET